jgi:hypothetical protein
MLKDPNLNAKLIVIQKKVSLEHLQKTLLLKPVKLVASISVDNVTLLIGLKVPWSDDDSVTNTHPDSFLHSTGYAPYANLTILTSHSDPIKTEHLDDDSVHLSFVASGSPDTD